MQSRGSGVSTGWCTEREAAPAAIRDMLIPATVLTAAHDLMSTSRPSEGTVLLKYNMIYLSSNFMMLE